MHDEFDAQLAVQRRCRRRIRCKATAGQRIPTAAPPIGPYIKNCLAWLTALTVRERKGARGSPQQKRVIVLHQ